MNSDDSLLHRLEQLNAIGVALSKERNITNLLESILLAAKTIMRADGGTLYRMNHAHTALRFEILRTDSLQFAMGGSSGRPIHFPEIPLFTPEGVPNDSHVAAYAAIHARTVNISNAYTEADFDFSGTRIFDVKTGYRSQSFLTVPMKDHDGDVIGVLQLINAKRLSDGAVIPFSLADQNLAESLASQAAIAITNRHLVGQMEVLFESFINVLNLALDEKSRHTGGHCQRVPALTMMLAEAVSAHQEGTLARFRMNERDRYELKIASLLHDCGKVTTPVHIVDKATKLQTLFDRIELVDTRFEVKKRDAEIAMLRAQLALRTVQNPQAEAALQTQYQAQQQAMDTDRDFLRVVNRGAESMSDSDLQRVRDIGEASDFLTDDELENLTIRAGTLTPKEREIINYHIVATIKMLEQLPWPKHLKNVPEYAGGHHERMDGRGYPKGLMRNQMSVQARIMGIADIFEALTARDRPYKEGMKLSQAMRIMQKFSQNGHIDPDIFAIFVKEKVYLRYATAFLEAWQIDALDDALAPPKS
ncbi:MAG: hypothetical protein RIR79_897 [Pseudomonadota bacterium]